MGNVGHTISTPQRRIKSCTRQAQRVSAVDDIDAIIEKMTRIVLSAPPSHCNLNFETVFDMVKTDSNILRRWVDMENDADVEEYVVPDFVNSSDNDEDDEVIVDGAAQPYVVEDDVCSVVTQNHHTDDDDGKLIKVRRGKGFCSLVPKNVAMSTKANGTWEWKTSRGTSLIAPMT